MTSRHTPWTPDQPIVTITITDPDTLHVTVFGIGYHAPDDLLPLRRASFGTLMDHLYDRLRQPFTVEIIETDGSRQTGTINLADHATTDDPGETPPLLQPYHLVSSPVDPTWEPPDETTLARRALPVAPEPTPPEETTPNTALLHATGYQPGEQTYVAVVVTSLSANMDGDVRFDVPWWVVEALPAGKIVVTGCVSRTVTILEPLPVR
ncbi:MAG: hypothetical protein LBI33_09605 [Propionibacteriaceae bacterium]|jgi:hypothetical protein|nr:hypothetical protein [Propionibacteriaceae bacterium]